MSDDGLLAWATLWGKRVAALALLAGLAAGVVGAGILAVGALVDSGPTDSGLTGNANPTPTPAPPGTPTATPTPTSESSTGADNESSEAATRVVVGVDVVDVPRPGRYRVTVIEAVEYWRGHTNLTGYAVQPVVRPDATDPDVVVRVQPEVTCEGETAAVGCAPQLSNADQLESPTVIRVEPRPNDRLTWQIVAHELGHVFGTGHCGEPRRVMYTDCPLDAREGDRPDAAVRDSPWDTETIRVYVDTSGYIPGRPALLEAQVRKALEYYERSFDQSELQRVDLRLVDDPYRADVRVNFSEQTRSCALPSVCSDRFGVSTDADDALEHYSYARIELAIEDPTLVGWQTGYQLGFILGAEDAAELPPAFRNASRVDATGDWWDDDGDGDEEN